RDAPETPPPPRRWRPVRRARAGADDPSGRGRRAGYSSDGPALDEAVASVPPAHSAKGRTREAMANDEDTCPFHRGLRLQRLATPPTRQSGSRMSSEFRRAARSRPPRSPLATGSLLSATLTCRARRLEEWRRRLRSERGTSRFDAGENGCPDLGPDRDHGERVDDQEADEARVRRSHPARDRQDGDDGSILVVVVPESRDPCRIRWVRAR